jgi:hypothetical protein
LHDFVRQPTILDYFVRDSALLGLDACAGRNDAGIDAHTIVAQALNAIVRSVRPDTLGFMRHLEKPPQRLALFLVRCPFEVARGRSWRKAAVRPSDEVRKLLPKTDSCTVAPAHLVHIVEMRPFFS